MTPDGKIVVLSGIRATGRMHLGNYLGVLERFATMSRDSTRKCYFFIADFHTLTTLKEVKEIRKNAPGIALDMIAAGVDVGNAVLYAQSRVPEVTEIMWYLLCLAAYGDMTRVPTFKEKSDKHPDDVNGGLFSYPVLMASDILGPRADFVPVGVDQKPHLEFTRDLARKFNRIYGDFFPIPGDLEEDMLSVPGLVALNERGGFGKMGKSEASDETLYLSDTPAERLKKILKAPTDPARRLRNDPGDPKKCAITGLHALLSSSEQQEWSAHGCRTAGIGCYDCKGVLAKNLEERLAGFIERRNEIASNPGRLEELIEEGSSRARVIFAETASYMGDCMGLYRPKR